MSRFLVETMNGYLRLSRPLMVLAVIFYITGMSLCCRKLPGSTCVCRETRLEDGEFELILECVKMTFGELLTVLENFSSKEEASPMITNLVLRNSDLKDMTHIPVQLTHLKTMTLLKSGLPLTTLRDSASQLAHLTTLYIDNENLTVIPPKMFAGFPCLRELHIYNSPGLKDVENQAFDQLHDSLRVLVLKENGLTNIPKAVTSLVALEKLDLYDNKIKTVPDDMVEFLDDMKYLNNLIMNSLNCSCEFGRGDFVGWVQRMAIKGAMCAVPERLYQMDVSTLRKDEFCNAATSTNQSSFALFLTFCIILLTRFKEII